MPDAKVGERWAVLGGGMLGLTLAHRLNRAGHRVTVIEAAPELGGLTAAWTVGDVVWDRYYHVITTSDDDLRRLLAELDLEREICWQTTRTDFFTGTAHYPLNNVFDFLRFPALGLVDKARLALTILHGSRIADGGALEATPVRDWLVRLSGRRTYETLWLPLLRAKLGDNHRHASAAFIWSVIRRFYGARRGSTRTEMFGYVPGGYGRIVDALATRLRADGVEIRSGAPVRAVARADGGLRVETAAGDETFDRVAVTFASPFAARLCDGLDDDERARLQGIRHQGIVCASLLLSRPLGGAYLTYITDPEVPFTALIEMTALVDPAELGGRHLVYLPKYLPADDPLFEADDATIEARFRAGLARLYPDLRDDQVGAFRVSRTRHVLAIPTLGYSSRLPPMVTSVPGLAIVNSAHIVNASLAVTETVRLANQAAERLLAEGGGGR